MMKRFATLTITLMMLTACESTSEETRREVQRPANVIDPAGDIFASQLPEYVAGTQEDLVAHVGDRVFFELDSSNLSANAQRTLQRQAEWMKMNPDLKVIIEGHCDERGTREYNLALGERRATAAKNYLVSLGVSPDRATTISYGKEFPEDPRSTDVAWSKNRRAVTVVSR